MSAMVVFIRATYPSIVWLDVRPSSSLCLAANNAKGGKKILGLSNAWSAVHRSNRGAEVAVGGKRKVELLVSPMYILTQL